MSRKKFILGISIVFLVVTAFTGGETVISGKVFSNDPDIAKCIMIVKVVAKKGNKTLAVGHELLDTTGVYSLNINGAPTEQNPVNIFISGLYVDTMYVRSYSSFSGSNIPLDIEIPTKYKLDDAGNAICPICNSSANILPVKYGTHKHIKRIIHNGDTTYVPLEHLIPSAMQTALRPYWYCQKCKIQF
jgi:hypothetical protein